jgi:cyanophycinase
MGDMEPVVTFGNGSQCKGSLFLIGGAANTTLADFVKLAGGDNAQVVIFPHATSDPVGAAKDLTDKLTALGVKQVTTILPGTSATLSAGTTAVFFTGGDQMRLVQLVEPSLIRQLVVFLNNGGLIGGTSAGAAAMPRTMIGGGMDDGVIRPGSLVLTPGLGILDGAVVDTHVGQRNREARSIAAIALLDYVWAIALDEDTAVHITPGKLEVYGQGHARLFRATNGTRAKLAINKTYSAASVQDVNCDFLVAGDEFVLW